MVGGLSGLRGTLATCGHLADVSPGSLAFHPAESRSGRQGVKRLATPKNRDRTNHRGRGEPGAASEAATKPDVTADDADDADCHPDGVGRVEGSLRTRGLRPRLVVSGGGGLGLPGQSP